MKRRCDRPVAGAVAAGALAAAAFGLLVAGCAPTPAARFDPSRSSLPLDAWVSVLPADSDQVRPCVRVAAPYRSLVFRRDGERFHSGLQVSVTAWRDGVQAGGGVGKARATVGGYEATLAETPLEVSVPLLVRGDEPVTLEVSARVLDSSRGWLRELSFSPRALATMPVWIAAVAMEPAAPPTGVVTLTAAVDSLRLAVTLKRRGSADWPGTGLSLVSEVTGAAGGELVLLRHPVPGDLEPGHLEPGESREVALVWPTGRLPFGRCRLQVLVELSRDAEWVRLPHEPALELVNLRVALTDDEAWRRHLDWLEGTLADARRDSLRGLAAAARPSAWADVWRDLGADAGLAPPAAERRHLERVVAADDRFGDHGRGADSDRGRALIRWGEPARVEAHADSRVAGAVWEVWDYPDRNRRLFFYDAHGSGDFRLRRDEALA